MTRCGEKCALRDYIQEASPECDNVQDVAQCPFHEENDVPKINISMIPAFSREQLLELAQELQERDEVIALEARLAELRAKHGPPKPAAGELPKPLQVARFDSLVDMVTDAVEKVANGRPSDDLRQYVFEAAVEAVYGKAIWEWWREHER